MVLRKSLEYQTHVLQRRCRCLLSILPAGFWHLLNECMLPGLRWAFPLFIYKTCMRVSGHPTLSVHSPGPPPSLPRRETGAWMKLFVSHFRPPRFMPWLLYGSQRLTRCLHNLRFSSFSRLAACHPLPHGNPGHNKRAAGSSCHISVHSCKCSLHGYSFFIRNGNINGPKATSCSKINSPASLKSVNLSCSIKHLLLFLYCTRWCSMVSKYNQYRLYSKIVMFHSSTVIIRYSYLKWVTYWLMFMGSWLNSTTHKHH